MHRILRYRAIKKQTDTQTNGGKNPTHATASGVRNKRMTGKTDGQQGLSEIPSRAKMTEKQPSIFRYSAQMCKAFK